MLKYSCYLLFLKTILLLREMYILYTFYFSYLWFKQVSHCSRQVFISFNCLRFEWDNIHKILNPVPGIQQEHAIVTILFIKYWEWRTDVEGILSSWCWRCFAHVSFWIMVFSVICSVVVILFLVYFLLLLLLFVCLRNRHTALQVAVSIYIPINNVREFPFLHTLSSIYCLQVFW